MRHLSGLTKAPGSRFSYLTDEIMEAQGDAATVLQTARLIRGRVGQTVPLQRVRTACVFTAVLCNISQTKLGPSGG